MRYHRLLVMVGVLLLTGCVGLPSSGGVQQGLERAPEPEGIVFLAPDPQPGAEPEEVVEGFLDAATAGVAERFQTAQKYLTDGARDTWDPGAQVTIYTGSSPPQVEEESPGEVSVTFTVDGYVDSAGIYTEEPATTSETIDFELTDESGQWRIESVEDGVLISAVNFASQFRQVPLAFFSADGDHIVPDPRWFPEQNAASFAINALVEGPVEWMNPAVVTAIPPGTVAEPVNISDGIAEVRLSPAALAASPTDRAMVVTQVQNTLQELPQVRKVEVVVDDIAFDPATPGMDSAPNDPALGHAPLALLEEGLAAISNAGATLMEDDLGDDHSYSALAIPYGERDKTGLSPAFKHPTRGIVTVDAGGDEHVLIEGKNLVDPSYDAYGWVWSASPGSPGTITAANAETHHRVDVEAAGLTDRRIQVLRVSRDGSRIVIVQGNSREAFIQVATVIRDEGGRPVEISEPVEIGQSITNPRDVAWVDSVTLAVLTHNEEEESAVYLLPVAGPVTELNPIEQGKAVVSGKGEREIWVVTEEGRILNRAGNSWRQIGEDEAVVDLAYPG